MKTNQIIGRNLASLRKARGLTQGQIAEKFNYSDKSISKWEHGEMVPDVETLLALADFYGVTVDFLLTKDAGVNHKENSEIKSKNTHAKALPLKRIGLRRLPPNKDSAITE